MMRRRTARMVITGAVFALLGSGEFAKAQPPGASQGLPAVPAATPISFAQVLALPASPADAKLSYGTDSLHTGELRLPKGTGRFPIVVLLHGGCWLAQYNAGYLAAMGAALAADGFAVWTPEFRRVGNVGGGYPGTFLDAAAATDFVRTLAKTHPIDTTRVVLAGHSAGGQLALLVAGRRTLKSGHPLASNTALKVKGVVSIAGITDLAGYAGTSGCNAAVPRLLGGMPSEQFERYQQFSPSELLPSGIPTRLLNGYLDRTVPADQGRAYAKKAFAAGDDSQFILLEHSAHFDPVAPTALDWPAVLGAIRAMSKDF